MASTYTPGATAKDRVRALIDDRRAPFRFTDEEIVFALNGGDDTAAELTAAIELMESESTSLSATTSIRQGSYARTRAAASNTSRIANLRLRLATLGGSNGASQMAGADSEFPHPESLPPCQGNRLGRFEDVY